MIIEKAKTVGKYIFKIIKKINISSVLFGLVFSWIIKNGLTRFLFQGKSFQGRNFSYKLFLIVFCTCFFSTLFLIFSDRLRKINWIETRIIQISNTLQKTVKELGRYRIILLLLAVLIFCIGFINLLDSLNPLTNDDAFVYYNYARNFVEGRPFAYDVRNIPSEGFTSLIYLLLLTPFEFFKINMTFASILINLIAIGGVVFTLGKLIKTSKMISFEGMLAFLTIYWICIINDQNIKTGLEWGLETMLGPLITSFAGIALNRSIVLPYNRRAINTFFVFMFLAYLIRPESMIIIALAGLPILLLNKPSRKEMITKTIIFAFFFILFHLLKYLLFGDIMPTGYYRNVSGNSEFGFRYVTEWIYAYRGWIVSLIIVIVMNVIYSINRHRWPLISSKWLLFLSSIMLLTILFFTQTHPLIGIGYRFLITPIFLLYFLLVFLLLYLLDHSNFLLRSRKPLFLGIMVSLTIFVAIDTYSDFSKSDFHNSLDIYSKSEKATEEHEYLRLGYYLHNSIPQAEDITLVFGDAGAIPYSFGGRFIDSNGLTEPAIAHLFQQQDGPQKNEAYIRYILSQQPDIIVLGVGDLQADGTWHPYANEHSPFKQALPIEVYQAYQEYGIVYSCTVKLYYDVYIGLWEKSPNYSILQTAFRSYCSENGYVSPDGLIINDGIHKVSFPLDSQFIN